MQIYFLSCENQRFLETLGGFFVLYYYYYCIIIIFSNPAFPPPNPTRLTPRAGPHLGHFPASWQLVEHCQSPAARPGQPLPPHTPPHALCAPSAGRGLRLGCGCRRAPHGMKYVIVTFSINLFLISHWAPWVSLWGERRGMSCPGPRYRSSPRAAGRAIGRYLLVQRWEEGHRTDTQR